MSLGLVARSGRQERTGHPRQWRLRIAVAVLVVFVLIAVFGPLIAEYDAVRVSTRDRLLPPGSRLADGSLAVLGTDHVGRDVLEQVIEGARVSLLVGLTTLIFAGVSGVAIGVLAGFYRGWLDPIFMRLADIQLAFPSILLAILIAAVLGPSLINVVITLSVAKWVIFARVARAQAMTLRERDFVEASRVLGASNWHIIKRCILPGLFAPIMVVSTVELGLVILAESTLSFLGLGAPGDTPSWGYTIAIGRGHLSDAWWIATFPGVALATLVVAFGTMGDELRDRFDPNLRSM